MSSEPAISIRGLSKAYVIQHNATKHRWLADALLDRLRHPFRKAQTETFYALRDVNVDIAQGEAIGIIGHNGAGKSTLLKVISRITPPTEGYIDLRGRVGSLLEVGTGFHPELTGRENIYLNGAILGMTRGEIKRQFDDIVEFAGVEKFLDTPVKRYSSGMYVRLAFAVAAHLEPEILVVDEVLAVGDAEFQKKCLGKMQNVAGHGRTVLFISHNMAAIQALCSRVIVLKRGSVMFDGDPTTACSQYTQMLNEAAASTAIHGKRIKVQGATVEATAGGPPEPLGDVTFRIPLQFEQRCDDPWVHLYVESPYGELVFGIGSWDLGQRRFESGTEFEFAFHVHGLPLLPGAHRVYLDVGSEDIGLQERIDLGSLLQVAEKPVYGSMPLVRSFHGSAAIDVDLKVSSPALTTE